MNRRLFGLIALLLAGCFAGAAVYISLAEHPARLALDDRAVLTQWSSSYSVGIRMQAPLAVMTGLSGVGAWWATRDWRWLAGAALMAANLPFTLLALLPINTMLLATPSEAAGPESRRLIESWGQLHAVRSGLGILSALAFLWVLATPTADRLEHAAARPS